MNQLLTIKTVSYNHSDVTLKYWNRCFGLRGFCEYQFKK